MERNDGVVDLQRELEVEGMSQGWQMTGCGADARDVPRMQGASFMTRACQLLVCHLFSHETKSKYTRITISSILKEEGTNVL